MDQVLGRKGIEVQLFVIVIGKGGIDPIGVPENGPFGIGVPAVKNRVVVLGFPCWLLCHCTSASQGTKGHDQDFRVHGSVFFSWVWGWAVRAVPWHLGTTIQKKAFGQGPNGPQSFHRFHFNSLFFGQTQTNFDMIFRDIHSRVVPFVLALAMGGAFMGMAQKVPSPQEAYGFRGGDDYNLADYGQIEQYLDQLDRASDRVKKIEIGETVLGRKMYLLFISSEQNLAQLDRWKEISAKLARAKIGDREAQALSLEGRAIVWVDGGMHSTELAHGQMTSELAYTLATSETAEMRNIRDNVVTLLMPVMNPDGLDLVVDWYRKHLGTPYETSRLPVLYHYYM